MCLTSTSRKQKAALRYSDPSKEKRDRVILIRSYNYDRPAKVEDISWDFDDALTIVLDRWEKTKGKSGYYTVIHAHLYRRR